jgi:hypothetical protein
VGYEQAYRAWQAQQQMRSSQVLTEVDRVAFREANGTIFRTAQKTGTLPRWNRIRPLVGQTAARISVGVGSFTAGLAIGGFVNDHWLRFGFNTSGEPLGPVTDLTLEAVDAGQQLMGPYNGGSVGSSPAIVAPDDGFMLRLYYAGGNAISWDTKNAPRNRGVHPVPADELKDL